MDNINFSKDNGLVPAVVQDAQTGRVLMLGYMNQAAIDKTSELGKVTFFSRSKQRLWTDKEDSASPTMLLKLVMITSIIDAKEGCEVAIINILNAFVQTKMEGEHVIMKMQGKLAELLVDCSGSLPRLHCH